MRSHVRTAATVAIMAGVLAGCSTTTTGTVAQTTEPGPPLRSSRAPTSSPPTESALPTLTNAPLPGPRRSSVPAPANWSTMTCREYGKLDDDTKLAVVEAIMAAQAKPVRNENVVPVFKALADAMCDVLPSSTVSDMLTGGGMPR